jgi:hypothetical protein
MAVGVEKIPTLAERENLMKESRVHHVGFTPRPIQKLTTRRRPHTMLDIECRHFLRTSMPDFTTQVCVQGETFLQLFYCNATLILGLGYVYQCQSKTGGFTKEMMVMTINVTIARMKFFFH